MSNMAEINDPVIRGALAALERAAQDARRIAIQTGTELIIMRNGKLCLIPPDEIADLPPVAAPIPQTERLPGP
jgi:hypothetical protein